MFYKPLVLYIHTSYYLHYHTDGHDTNLKAHPPHLVQNMNKTLW